MVLSAGTGVVVAPGRVQTSAPGPTRAARRAGSGLKASEWMGWPSAGRRGIGRRGSAVAHSVTAPSRSPVASQRPSGLSATALMTAAPGRRKGRLRALSRASRSACSAASSGGSPLRVCTATASIASSRRSTGSRPAWRSAWAARRAGLAAALLGVGVGARAPGLGLGGRGARALGGEVGGLLARAELEQAEHAEREDARPRTASAARRRQRVGSRESARSRGSIAGQRAAGSASRPRSTTRCSHVGTSAGRRPRAGTPRSIAARRTSGCSPVNGRTPCSASCSAAQKLKTSLRRSASPPASCSGAMYAGVPSTAPGVVRRAGSGEATQHGEHVGARVDRELAAELLGRHVQRRAEQVPVRVMVRPRAGGGRRPCRGRRPLVEAREPEVHDLHPATRADHHVVGLEVAVDEPGIVGGLQALAGARGTAPGPRARVCARICQGRAGSALRRTPWRGRPAGRGSPTSWTATTCGWASRASGLGLAQQASLSALSSPWQRPGAGP